VHIRLDANELTLDDLESLEGTRLDPDKSAWKQIREILARFCFHSSDPDSEKMEYEEAYAACGKLTLRETNKLIGSVGEMMSSLQEDSLPPV